MTASTMPPFNKEPALAQEWVLEATWTDLPDDVAEEIKDLWASAEFGNDNYYYSWDDAENEEGPWWDYETPLAALYPKIHAYLKEKNITSCLIHYWW